MTDDRSDYINEKTPKVNQGLFRELEFKVFARTVKNELKWSFWKFGRFSDIGYVKTMASGIAGKARNHSIWYRRFTNPKVSIRKFPAS